MQQLRLLLILFVQNFLEMARHGQLNDFNVTADFGKKDRVITHAVINLIASVVD